MISYVIGIFALVAMAEIYSLRVLSEYISTVNTITFIMFTFIGGIFMGRSWGDEYFDKLLWHLRSRTMPVDETVNGVVMATAAMMLIMPGVITDFFAVLIMIPLTRPLFKGMVVRLLKSRIDQGKSYFFLKD